MRALTPVSAVCLFLVTAPASLAMPIPGKLMVVGHDFTKTIVYFMEGDSSSVTPAPLSFYNGDVSPDGLEVTYIAGVTDILVHVWKAGIDGSTPVNLTEPAGLTGVNCYPRWSPDGSKIAFQHAEPQTGQLPCEAGFHVWIINADGTGAYPVTPPGFVPTTYPRWAPNGARILCEARSLGITFMDTDGANVQVLPNVGATPALSPDGSKIVSSRWEYSEIHQGTWRRLVVTNVDGSSPQVVAERFVSDADVLAHLAYIGLPADQFHIDGLRCNIGPIEPEWAPTGHLIVFSAAIPLQVQAPHYDLQREVWMYSFAMGYSTRVTTNAWSDSGFSWRGDNTYPDHPTVTVDNTTVTFTQVTDPGLTTIILDDSPPQLPGGYRPAGPFYRIQTTANVVAPTDIAMTYSDEELPPDLPEGEISLLRYDAAGFWEDITTSRDPHSNVIHGATPQLSIFGLAGFVPHTFSDVTPGGYGPHGVDPFWAYDAIDACVAAGVVSGLPDGTYHPTDPVTRDQMAVYTSRALAGGDASVPAFTGTPTFSDVPQGNWALKYVEYAVANSIVKGYSDNTYHPEYQVDRGQMAVFIARAIATPTDRPDLPGYTPPGDPTFPDVTADNTWSWAHKFVEYIAENDVTQGYPDGKYHPEYFCTRDQMAVYVSRAFDLPM